MWVCVISVWIVVGNDWVMNARDPEIECPNQQIKTEQWVYAVMIVKAWYNNLKQNCECTESRCWNP